MSLTPEQAAWRNGKITASKVAASYTNSYGGMYASIGRDLGLIPPMEETAFMTRGNKYEPRIIDMVTAATGLYAIGEQAQITHPDNSRYGATLDSLLCETPSGTLTDTIAPLEIKTVGRNVKWNTAYWKSQITWQMLITGHDKGMLAVAVIDDTEDELVSLRMNWIEAEPFLQESLIKVAETYLDHLDAGTLPPADTPESLPYVIRLQPLADKDADAVPLDVDVVARFVALKAAEKAAKEERQVLEARIRQTLGEATHGAVDGYRVNLGANANILTAEGEAQLLADHPHLGKTTLDKDAAKAAGVYDSYKQPAGARRLNAKATNK